jgi:hypothetical protein
MSRFAVDPGTLFSGWAFGRKQGQLQAYGLEDDKQKNYAARSVVIAKGLCEQIAIYKPSELVIELPRVFHAGAGNQAKESGSILKLSMMVGILIGLSSCKKIGLLSAGIWQGQLKKPIIYKRMKYFYGQKIKFKPTTANLNVSDAIGLLHYSWTTEHAITWLSL